MRFRVDIVSAEVATFHCPDYYGFY